MPILVIVTLLGDMLRLVLSPRRLFRYSVMRQMNSLHSPMFPQRTIPDVEEIPPKKKDSPDFLDAHGGKLLLAVISTIGFMIYRWIKGGNNKLKVEDSIAHQSPLHPYESNQFRVSNSITGEEFLTILKSSRQKNLDGLLSYEEFIQLFRELHPKQLSMAYYLDRVILSYLETIQQNPSSKIPLSIFLVALGNALQLPPQDRSEILFDVCQSMTSSEIEFLKVSGSSTALVDQDSSLYCSLPQIISLVNILDITWQVVDI